MKTHTVLIVAHRLTTIKNVDRILVFEKGEIVEDAKLVQQKLYIKTPFKLSEGDILRKDLI